MFSLFRNKTSLCEILRTGFTDFHSHVLPGIDDGSSHIDQSKELLSALHDIGVHTLYCTPHIMHSVYDNTPEIIQSTYNTLKEEARLRNIKLHVAAEYMLDDGFAKQLKAGPLLAYPNREVLVEMNYVRAPLSLHQHIFELRTSGYTPVLAHPERYAFYHNSFSNYEQLRDMGCKFQLNLLSLGSYYGKQCNKIALQLLQHEMYTHVGTDTHKLRHIEALRTIKINKQQAVSLEKVLKR